jgi:hypothetical protein
MIDNSCAGTFIEAIDAVILRRRCLDTASAQPARFNPARNASGRRTVLPNNTATVSSGAFEQADAERPGGGKMAALNAGDRARFLHACT